MMAATERLAALAELLATRFPPTADDGGLETLLLRCVRRRSHTGATGGARGASSRTWEARMPERRKNSRQ